MHVCVRVCMCACVTGGLLVVIMLVVTNFVLLEHIYILICMNLLID